MVAPRSKRALAEWYRTTAIQQIRPVAIEALSSQAYWKQWEKMDSAKLASVADLFFRKLAELEPSSADAVMFDTTNYYTFMAGNTASELAQRGRNKEGRHWLRQVGVALLVARDNRLPLFYREYEGNRHDSKVFLKLADELFAVAGRGGQGTMTIVFDKGINAEENIAAIDAHDRLHFVTSYSPHYAEDLIHVDRNHFQVVDTAKNLQLKAQGRDDDLLLAWSTSRELWGRERRVVVTYNPRTATKQRYAFEQKMLQLEEELHLMRHKVNSQAAQWRNPDTAQERYLDLCRELHLPDDLYRVELFRDDGKRLRMNCRKNHYRIGRQSTTSARTSWSPITPTGAPMRLSRPGWIATWWSRASARARITRWWPCCPCVTGPTARSGAISLPAWWPWPICVCWRSDWPETGSGSPPSRPWRVCAPCTPACSGRPGGGKLNAAWRNPTKNRRQFFRRWAIKWWVGSYDPSSDIFLNMRCFIDTKRLERLNSCLFTP
jgi:hypothetical protein